MEKRQNRLTADSTARAPCGHAASTPTARWTRSLIFLDNHTGTSTRYTMNVAHPHTAYLRLLVILPCECPLAIGLVPRRHNEATAS